VQSLARADIDHWQDDFDRDSSTALSTLSTNVSDRYEINRTDFISDERPNFRQYSPLLAVRDLNYANASLTLGVL